MVNLWEHGMYFYLDISMFLVVGILIARQVLPSKKNISQWMFLFYFCSYCLLCSRLYQTTICTILYYNECFCFILQLLSIVFKALSDHHVFLEGAILKTSMCTPGKSCSETTTPEEIGGATVQALQRTVPPALAGVLVLLLLITYWHWCRWFMKQHG